MSPPVELPVAPSQELVDHFGLVAWRWDPGEGHHVEDAAVLLRLLDVRAAI